MVVKAITRHYLNEMEQRTKKQHLVPRFYLERFRDPDGFVWTYANGKKPFGRIPLETGVETNFYSPIGEDGERIDDAELLLSEIENAAAPHWDSLLDGEVMKGLGRDNIAIFVAAQYLRSPASVSAAAELSAHLFQQIGRFTAMHKEAHEDSMDKFDAHTGQTTSPEQRESMRNFILDTDSYHLDVSRYAGISVLNSIETIAEHLLNMRWVVGRSKGQHLITSDCPVSRVTDPNTHSPLRGDGGFRNKTVRINLPLSSKHMLEMNWGGEEREGVVDIPRQMAREMNRLRAVKAERFVFAHRRDDGIEKLCNKWLFTDNAPRIQTNQKSAEIRVKRKV